VQLADFAINQTGYPSIFERPLFTVVSDRNGADITITLLAAAVPHCQAV